MTLIGNGRSVLPAPPASPVQPSQPPRKIAILGKAPSSLPEAPFDDMDWEIWILNTAGYANEVPRWDRQFELHDLEQTKAPEYGQYYDWLKVQERPVFLRDEPPPDFVNGVQYPLGQVLAHGDGFRHHYVTVHQARHRPQRVDGREFSIASWLVPPRKRVKL